MKRLLGLLTVYLSLSCSTKNRPTLSAVLKSDCFWDITGVSNVRGGRNSCYKFSSDGKCRFYYYNFYARKITDSVFEYDDDDNLVPQNWSTQGDTILVARGTQFSVLNFSTDSITIIGLNDTMILRTNCNTRIEKGDH